MSAINSALSKLASDQSAQMGAISKAEVKPVKQLKVLPWVVGSFTLSLAVGGWALSQQAPSEPVSQATIIDSHHSSSQSMVASPTTKVAVVEQPIYQSVSEQDIEPAPKVAKSVTKKVEPKEVAQPVLLARNETKASAELVPVAKAQPGEVHIEQVELTPEQLSQKAQVSAKKALDNNNLADAISYYAESLRYTPNNKKVRKRLAALYYGKGEVRKAADLLQKGISLDKSDSTLRLSLAKMLMKEQQNGVALTVLSTLPQSPSVEYLSLRAALAQKEKQDELALQSYLQLVEQEPESARWWMGLGIQQERAFQLAEAKDSYTQALSKLGLSSQSQQFIRDRIALIENLEEQPSEN